MNPSQTHPEMPPWALSLLGHALLAGLFGAAFWALRYSPSGPHVDIDVIEAPHEAPLPIRLLKPETKPKPPRKEHAVFGVSPDSNSVEAPTVEVKAGNTVAKAPDHEIL